MGDLKQLMEHNYLQYASYVVLDRAIPDVVDGLKPVQRRILQTLFLLSDGRLHKVANVVGQTMTLHPHGDSAIFDALVNLSNKGYLLDQQGNFGNIFTGDPAAAARYIETRLSPLALETLFNPQLTSFIPSYDGRAQEPITLPAKLPLLLLQGAEGIAVGMSTRILPHNFNELLEAQIAILEGRDFTILPDFPTGGVMDASEYEKGRGKVKVRARLTVVDDKTISIEEVAPGTTTESLIRSIDETAKRGKIKIDSINDYTTEKVSIEIKLPRGQYAQDMLEKLYAFTDCEVSVSTSCIAIRDDLPWETDVHQILELNTAKLKDFLKKELELERDRLQELVFKRTLERIFIENRLYKKIETVKEFEKIHETIAKALKPFQKDLLRVPTKEDRDFLLGLPIRRISRFDIDRNQEEIAKFEEDLQKVERDLKNLKAYTIRYLKHLIKKYGDDYPRKTRIKELEEVDRRELETKEIKVYFDPMKGFIGTHVSSESYLECTNFDKLLLMFQDGSYTVTNIPEKQYVGHDDKKLAYVGVADKQTVFSVVYKDPTTSLCYAKRFIVSKFLLDKPYRFLDEGMKLEYLSSAPEVEIELSFKPKAKQKVKKQNNLLSEVAIKGVTAKGIRLSTKEVKKVKVIKRADGS